MKAESVYSLLLCYRQLQLARDQKQLITWLEFIGVKALAHLWTSTSILILFLRPLRYSGRSVHVDKTKNRRKIWGDPGISLYLLEPCKLALSLISQSCFVFQGVTIVAFAFST